MQKPKRRGCLWAVLIVAGLVLVIFVALATMPVEADEEIPESEWGVGTITIEPAWTGLKREWPQVEELNNFDPATANLGYQLFFDPIVSGDNTKSCAHCHHPDLGFSDGQKVATGLGGEVPPRNAPTLWNVAYNTAFMWDGRAETLEDHLQQVITSSNEMGQDMEELVEEIQAIPAYQEQFDTLFADGITQENVLAAIAMFERSLISDGAAFDLYVDGNFEALTAQQRRGLGIFRSAASRCFECHSAPTFTDDDFRVVGVPDDDYGDRGYGAQVGGEGMDYAFKIPTLRNVVLSAPYMHNGHFDSLEEIVDFYSKGGGLEVGFEADQIDRSVAPGFTLSEQETADLVAFLYALTDETIPERLWEGLDYVDSEGRVVIPTEVPSSSEEIVEPIDNPARETLTNLVADPDERAECNRDADTKTVTVSEGQTIQQGIDCAEPGDTVLVPPGVYHERVLIDLSGITLRGLIDEEPQMCPVQKDGLWPTGEDAPNWPILDGDIDGDGTKDLTDGVIASGNDFTIEYFIVQNYQGNGVLAEGVRGVTMRHIFTSDTGLYGVYPVRSNDVLVECNVTTLASDAGIYVGQSQDIVVRNNLAYDGVTGIEIENSVNADVYENETWNNTGGILVFLLPNIHSRVSHDIKVHDNYVHHNNRQKEDATPGSIVGKIPVGTGIFLMATDNTEVYNNKIEGNQSFGVGITSLYQAYEPEEIGDVGPLAENNHIYDNTYIDNGNDPSQEVKDAGLPGADVLWDARGYGNHVDEENAKTFPPLISGEGWPSFMKRALFQIWNFLGKNM